jgi:hypothetical protein
MLQFPIPRTSIWHIYEGEDVRRSKLVKEIATCNLVTVGDMNVPVLELFQLALPTAARHPWESDLDFYVGEE